MSGEATFQLEEADLSRAGVLATWSALKGWRGALGLLVAAGAFGAVSGWRADILVVVPVLAAFWVWGMLRWVVPWQARRLFRQQRDLHGPMRASWTDKALRLETSTGETRTPWADLRRWREDAHVILLYRSDAIYTPIPRRALTDGQAADLRRAAAAAGVVGAAP